jgi:hypothetical protein
LGYVKEKKPETWTKLKNEEEAKSVFMQAFLPSHHVQLDSGALDWPTEAAVILADSASIDSFTKQVAGDKLAVYVWEDSSSATSSGNGRTLVGVAAASITWAPRSRSTISVAIHALSIKVSSRGRGLGQLLYGRLHQTLFEIGQHEYARLVFEKKAACEPLSVLPRMELHVLPGSCRRRADSLVLYANNHWRVTYNGGKDSLTWDVLKEWSGDETQLQGKDIELYLPPISLGAGYFSSAFDTDSRIVGTFPAFSEASAVRDARCGTNFVGEQLLTEITEIGPSRLKLSTQTGLLPFYVPSAPCRALDDFLSDPLNWVTHRGGPCTFPVRTLRVGGVSLSGFAQYDNINGKKHQPSLQAMRTARTLTEADVTELLEKAPGFALLARVVLGQLGYAKCSSSQLLSMLKAVHFFLVDDSRQTSFAWHTDDTDLDLHTRADKVNLRSAVIQLGDEARSAMQVLRFRPFSFEGRGAGALFHGAAVHRSIDLEPAPRAIWKVTLFLLLPLPG